MRQLRSESQWNSEPDSQGHRPRLAERLGKISRLKILASQDYPGVLARVEFAAETTAALLNRRTHEMRTVDLGSLFILLALAAERSETDRTGRGKHRRAR